MEQLVGMSKSKREKNPNKNHPNEHLKTVYKSNENPVNLLKGGRGQESQRSSKSLLKGCFFAYLPFSDNYHSDN